MPQQRAKLGLSADICEFFMVWSLV